MNSTCFNKFKFPHEREKFRSDHWPSLSADAILLLTIFELFICVLNCAYFSTDFIVD